MSFGPTSGVQMNFSTQTDRPGRFRLIRRNKGAHVIVIGNEKGGAGKSTVAMHLSIALLRMGKTIGAIDLDLRQRSFGRYLQNRRTWMENNGVDLPIPKEFRLEASALRNLDDAEAEEDARFQAIFSELKAERDFIKNWLAPSERFAPLAHFGPPFILPYLIRLGI